jgi:predicted nucleotidyltransferase
MKKFVTPIVIHKNLNLSIWKNDQLRPEVRKALLRIAKEFYKFLKVSVPIQDIVIYGSQANYNFTPNSDLDLHLIFNYNSIKCDEPIEALFDTKRKLWKEKHSIEIYGIPVELYAEDLHVKPVSSSYSVLRNTWIKHPSVNSIQWNKKKVKSLVMFWQQIIDLSVKTENYQIAEKLLSVLVKFRKVGLKQNGEFGIENLTFKSLRNSGDIEKLNNFINKIKDQDLSLD